VTEGRIKKEKSKKERKEKRPKDRVARVLVHPQPVYTNTVLALPGAGPRGFCPG